MKLSDAVQKSIIGVGIVALAAVWTWDYLEFRAAHPDQEPEPEPTEETHDHAPNEKGLVLDLCLCETEPVELSQSPKEFVDDITERLTDDEWPILTQSFTTVTGQVPDQATRGYLFVEFSSSKGGISLLKGGKSHLMVELESNKGCAINKKTYDQFKQAYLGPDL